MVWPCRVHLLHQWVSRIQVCRCSLFARYSPQVRESWWDTPGSHLPWHRLSLNIGLLHSLCTVRLPAQSCTCPRRTGCTDLHSDQTSQLHTRGHKHLKTYSLAAKFGLSLQHPEDRPGKLLHPGFVCTCQTRIEGTKRPGLRIQRCTNRQPPQYFEQASWNLPGSHRKPQLPSPLCTCQRHTPCIRQQDLSTQEYMHMLLLALDILSGQLSVSPSLGRNSAILLNCRDTRTCARMLSAHASPAFMCIRMCIRDLPMEYRPFKCRLEYHTFIFVLHMYVKIKLIFYTCCPLLICVIKYSCWCIPLKE